MGEMPHFTKKQRVMNLMYKHHEEEQGMTSFQANNPSEHFDIQAYMTKGVERVVSDAIKATLKNPRESAFMVKFAAVSKAASAKRKKAEKAGEHRPPFLIASITSSCNLHCAGCYSRCNHATVDAEPVKQLTSEEWLHTDDSKELAPAEAKQ